jgi:hypothetical protein
MIMMTSNFEKLEKEKENSKCLQYERSLVPVRMTVTALVLSMVQLVAKLWNEENSYASQMYFSASVVFIHLL